MSAVENLQNPTKPMVLSTFAEIIEKTPGMSFGQILYSILRPSNLITTADTNTVGWLLAVSDDEILSSMESALENDFAQEELLEN